MSSRFEELKAKGWMNLDGAEREEYKSLKPDDGKVKHAAASQSDSDDRLARMEKQMELLLNENSNLRQESAKLQEGWAEYKPPSDQNKTATLKVWREDADSPAGVVIKLATFKNNAFNEETRKNDKLIYSVTVCYDDGSLKELKIDASDFSKIREIEKVEIVKEDSRTLKKVEDYVTAPEFDKQGYPKRMLDGGGGYGHSTGANKVPLEVFMVKSTVTVRRKSGQEIQMESDNLNL